MEILYGKPVAENIEKDFQNRIKNLVSNGIYPCIAVLGLNVDDSSKTYIKKIKKNCEKYGIKLMLQLSENEHDFKKNFINAKDNKEITGIMFQQPMPKKIAKLINLLPPEKDVEGIGINNMGKLFLGEKDALIPCTSRAVIELLDYYKIDLTGKNVVIAGRSNIVGKPLIPQLLEKNATITVCHSRTKNLKKETSKADVVIMAIGKPKFLKKDFIKDGAILIDIGINFENGKLCGDIDFDDVKDVASKCSPVPGGIGIITNHLLIDNIIKSCELQLK